MATVDRSLLAPEKASPRKKLAVEKPDSPRQSRWAIRIPAACLFALAILLLCVSMPHLATGVQKITSASLATAWLMAIVFDLSQVVCEVAVLLIPLLGLKHDVRPACKAVIVSCTLMSIVLNIDAFLEHAVDWKGYILATIWGLLLPLGVLTLFYIGSAFVLHERDATSR